MSESLQWRLRYRTLLLSRVYTRATCCPATKLLPVCCPSVAGYKAIHVAEIHATCCSSAQHVAGTCRAACCSGVNAALDHVYSTNGMTQASRGSSPETLKLHSNNTNTCHVTNDSFFLSFFHSFIHSFVY